MKPVRRDYCFKETNFFIYKYESTPVQVSQCNYEAEEENQCYLKD